MTHYDRTVLTEILVYHWRTPTSGCGCGWHVLGASWPEHIADVYQASIEARQALDPPPWNPGQTLDPATAAELAYTSPQLFINSPTLILTDNGWLLVTPVPTKPDA